MCIVSESSWEYFFLQKLVDLLITELELCRGNPAKLLAAALRLSPVFMAPTELARLLQAMDEVLPPKTTIV